MTWETYELDLELTVLTTTKKRNLFWWSSLRQQIHLWIDRIFRCMGESVNGGNWSGNWESWYKPPRRRTTYKPSRSSEDGNRSTWWEG